jgi:hypothetical protein
LRTPQGKLFAADENPRTNAPVNWAQDATELYIEGFYQGAILLSRQVFNGKGSRGALVYPISYLYRHYVELRLKDLVQQINAYLEKSIPALDSSHSLRVLWQEYVKPIGSMVDSDFSGPVIVRIDDAIDELDKVDPNSQAFRYAFGKKGSKAIQGDIKMIGLENLEEKMYEIHGDLESLAFTVRNKTRDKLMGNC